MIQVFDCGLLTTIRMETSLGTGSRVKPRSAYELFGLVKLVVGDNKLFPYRSSYPGLLRERKEGAPFPSRIASAILILSTSRIATRNNIKQTVFRSRMRYVQQTFVEHRYRREGLRMKHAVVIAEEVRRA